MPKTTRVIRIPLYYPNTDFLPLQIVFVMQSWQAYPLFDITVSYVLDQYLISDFNLILIITY
jgi:hypothetical protein